MSEYIGACVYEYVGYTYALIYVWLMEARGPPRVPFLKMILAMCTTYKQESMKDRVAGDNEQPDGALRTEL